MENASADRNWLTTEQKIELGLDANEEYYQGSTGTTIHAADHKIVKRLDVSSEEQSARSRQQRKLNKSELTQAKNLVKEDLGMAWNDVSERIKIFAEKFITGSNADRKAWVDLVVKRKGFDEDGVEVLPLELDEETRRSLEIALEYIRDIQVERDQHRIDLLDRLAEEDAGGDEGLEDLDTRGEAEEDCPF